MKQKSSFAEVLVSILIFIAVLYIIGSIGNKKESDTASYSHSRYSSSYSTKSTTGSGSSYNSSKDIFDFCYLKDHVDMPRLASCIKTYIIDEPSMREKDMNGVCKRVALTFSNRQFRRNVEHSGDRNWLQIDVGVAFKMIQDFLETVNL